MRNLYLKTKEGNDPLAPQQIADRMKSLFDNVMVDAQYGVDRGKDQVQKYSDLAQDRGWPSSIVENTRRTWDGALMVDAWNDDAESEKFYTILLNQDNFILHFYEKLSWPVRRRIAKRIADAIDYRFELGDEI